MCSFKSDVFIYKSNFNFFGLRILEDSPYTEIFGDLGFKGMGGDLLGRFPGSTDDLMMDWTLPVST